MTEKHLYFAYGSNMSTDRLRSRIFDATPTGRANWPGMKLVFNKVASDGSGKANLVPDPSSWAWGVLFHFPSANWAVLDGFEPGYSRRSCKVINDAGQTLCAQVYLGIGATRDTPPHDWYRQYLINGAIEHGLPAEIIALILSLDRV